MPTIYSGIGSFGNWMGRLILPKLEQRTFRGAELAQVRGGWFEIYYAPDDGYHH